MKGLTGKDDPPKGWVPGSTLVDDGDADQVVHQRSDGPIKSFISFVDTSRKVCTRYCVKVTLLIRTQVTT